MRIPVVIIFLLVFHAVTKTTAQQSVKNELGIEFILIEPGVMTVGEFHPAYPVPDDTIKGAKRPLNMYMGEGRGYSAAEFEQSKEFALKSASSGFKVTISKAYYIGKFEITQGQWKSVMGNNPSTFKGSDDLPVETITWADASAFIKALNKKDPKHHYRMPTEFEWEYASRAGAQGDIRWDEIQKAANLNQQETLPVGQKMPNAWGLHDTLGNVWEWVSDYYNAKIFADPVPSKKGNVHVLKGSSFAGDVKNATYMTHAGGPGNGWDIGLRIVMEK